MAREFSDRAFTVIQGPGLNPILIGAAILTGLLAVPVYGVLCATLALAAAGFAYYGDAIRRVSQGKGETTEPGERHGFSIRSIPQLVVATLLATGTAIPLWFLNSGVHRSPHWNGTSLAIAAATWLLGPILMFLVTARIAADGKMGILAKIKALAKHPVATSLALTLVPLSLLIAEITITLVIYIAGHLPFYALDYMPMPLLAKRNEPAVMYSGIPHYHMIDYRSYPVEMFEKGYLDGLRHGYTFVSAMPASLSRPTRAGMDAEDAIGLLGPAYLIVRILFVVTIVSSLLAGFAIQAHWLGSIPTINRKKTAPSLPPGLPIPLNPIGS